MPDAIRRLGRAPLAHNCCTSFSKLVQLNLTVGKILQVDDFPEARKPAYKLKIDFGSDIGIKKSSAQITSLYTREDLVNRLILAVVNFPRKQIGSFFSEVLVLGLSDKNGDIVLLEPEKDVPLGSRMH